MFLFILFSLFAQPSQAAPKVGDFVEYEMSSTLNGPQPRNWISRTEIISLDSATKKFKLKETITEAGKQPATHESEIDQQLLIDAENDIKIAIQRCVQNGGRFVVVPVPAGNFRACLQPRRAADTDGTIWYTDTPALAIVKEEMFIRANRSRYLKRALKRFVKF